MDMMIIDAESLPPEKQRKIRKVEWNSIRKEGPVEKQQYTKRQSMKADENTKSHQTAHTQDRLRQPTTKANCQ